MDKTTEVEELAKRLKELRLIESMLVDVHDWFEKHEHEMKNVIDYCDLSDAINEVQNTLYDIEYTLEEDDEDE
jgi:hypothetical protein